MSAAVVKAIWWNSPGDGTQPIYQNIRMAPGVWSSRSLIYDDSINPPPTEPAGTNYGALSAGSITPALADKDGIAIQIDAADSGAAYAVIDNITPPPLIRSPWSNHGSLSAFFNVSQGAWFYRGNWWVIIQNFVSPFHVHVYKSPDRITWTEQDSGHAPQLLAKFKCFAPYWDGSSNLIRCALQLSSDTGGNFRLQDFDMVTGLWGSAHDLLATGDSSARLLAAGYAHSPDGDDHLVYDKITAGHYVYARLNSGSWSPTALLIASDSGSGDSNWGFVLPDGGVSPNRIHTAYRVFGDAQLHYQQIVNGALGVSHSMPNSSPAGENAPCGHPVISEAGELLIPFETQVAPAFNLLPQCYRGTPLSNLGAASSWWDGGAGSAGPPETIDSSSDNAATCSFLAFHPAPPTIFPFMADNTPAASLGAFTGNHMW